MHLCFLMWTLYDDIMLLLYHVLYLENDILFLPHALSHEMNPNGMENECYEYICIIIQLLDVLNMQECRLMMLMAY